MFVIRDKKSKAILHMWQSVPGERRKPEELLPDFDAKTMEFGRTDALSVPANFDIENGDIKPLAPPEPEVAAAPAPSLAQVKEATLAEFSRLSFELRKKLIPEHELQNAALGVYDDKRTQAIRDTVKAFRDEYKRLEAVVKKARSIKEVQALEPDFPTQVAAAVSSASRKGEKEKR
ncbi:hypothetical protein [Pyxidicoccus caerfyrddinensis]|uniref:hypothetical protein n=1 Tax=Pyxidicoccus caerfyrddinensis TaxID=2709663 RepID=UPI0013DA18F7|nr:hypothetical protein [Pyxidicoccus caerfyrddinensis]